MPFPVTENIADAVYLIGDCRPQVALPERSANGDYAADLAVHVRQSALPTAKFGTSWTAHVVSSFRAIYIYVKDWDHSHITS